MDSITALMWVGLSVVVLIAAALSFLLAHLVINDAEDREYQPSHRGEKDKSLMSSLRG